MESLNESIQKYNAKIVKAYKDHMDILSSTINIEYLEKLEKKIKKNKKAIKKYKKATKKMKTEVDQMKYIVSNLYHDLCKVNKEKSITMEDFQEADDEEENSKMDICSESDTTNHPVDSDDDIEGNGPNSLISQFMKMSLM
jgi:dTDP-4-amino-4,6-dideoxygalactose transaminase